MCAFLDLLTKNVRFTKMNYIDELAKELVSLYHAGYSPEHASAIVHIDHAKIMEAIFNRAMFFLDTVEPIKKENLQ